jgi:hypothetical protein
MEAAFSCGAAAAAGKILRAFRKGDEGGLASALDGAAQACGGVRDGSDAEERAELLDAVVAAIRLKLKQGIGLSSQGADLALLSHLAGEAFAAPDGMTGPDRRSGPAEANRRRNRL